MEKIQGNYLSQQFSNFPLDCETLDYLQTNQHMAEMLGAIAGDKVILSGCNVQGSLRNAGYVFVKTQDFPEGEVLRFNGGDKAHEKLHLVKDAIAVTANGSPYSHAYTQRWLQAGMGSGVDAEEFSWEDFQPLDNKTNRQLRQELTALQAQMAGLQPAPTGSIMIWPTDTTPTGWRLCDGSIYNVPAQGDELYNLYLVIGRSFSRSTDESGTFRLPDMQGRFVAGKGANDYDTINQKGGLNTVALSISEMPRHNHDSASSTSDATVQTSSGKSTFKFPANEGGTATLDEHARCVQITNRGDVGNDTLAADMNEAHTHNVSLYARGGVDAHENRPPYIVMNYIIKI